MPRSLSSVVSDDFQQHTNRARSMPYFKSRTRHTLQLHRHSDVPRRDCKAIRHVAIRAIAPVAAFGAHVGRNCFLSAYANITLQLSEPTAVVEVIVGKKQSIDLADTLARQLAERSGEASRR